MKGLEFPESKNTHRVVHAGKTLYANGVAIGQDMPKIIIPIVDKTAETIKAQAEKLSQLSFDAVEWRADFFEGLQDPAAVKEVLGFLKEILPQKLLLFTVRTAQEGGAAAVSDITYYQILKDAAATGLPDMIDVEMLKAEDTVIRCVDTCHLYDIAVVGSNHDFQKTPPVPELLRRFDLMRRLQADILKIAVMPQSKADVLSLLQATLEADESIEDRPLITMSMGGKGSVSRMTGELFGSAMTFGSVGTGSAPGQIPLEKLKTALSILHDTL